MGRIVPGSFANVTIHTQTGDIVHHGFTVVSDTTHVADNPTIDGQGRYRDPGMQIFMQVPDETGENVKTPELAIAEERRDHLEKPEGPPHEFGK